MARSSGLRLALLLMQIIYPPRVLVTSSLTLGREEVFHQLKAGDGDFGDDADFWPIVTTKTLTSKHFQALG